MKINISTTIDNYKNKKDQGDAIAKEVKSLGNAIKGYFSENNLTEYSSDFFTAKVSVSENVSFNEEYAIELLKEKFPEVYQKVIRTKEYIDQDVLEAQIYNNDELSNAISSAFTQKEPTVRLLVKAKKG